MGKNVHIWNIDEETHLKLRLLSTGRGVSMGKLLTDMVEKEWNADKTILDKLQKRKVKRLIKRFGRK